MAALGKLFISYSSKDTKIAERIEKRLNDLDTPCFRDKTDLKIGDSWNDELARMIEQSRGVILLWSQHAADSHNVRNEISFSLGKNIPIYPVSLDGTLLTGFLSNYHAIQHRSVDETVEEILKQLEIAPPPISKIDLIKRTLNRHKKRIRLIAAACLLILGAIVLIDWPEPAQVFVEKGPYPSGPSRESIYLDSFYMDTFPVTNAQYHDFLQATNHPPPPDWNSDLVLKTNPDHPVVNVSFKDADAYAAWAGKKLPTFYEWEKTCRGPEGFSYPWGNTWIQGICNTRESGYGITNPVGFFKENASPYGCMDMIGNVWEWTTTLDSTKKDWVLIVGSAFNQSQTVSRCFEARAVPKTLKMNNIGFRCISKNSIN